jgi:predicted nucleic acid-binding protein
MIAQTAIEFNLLLLQHDKDFLGIQKIIPKLKFFD